MTYRQTIDGCRASAIGQHGLSDGELSAALQRLVAPIEALKADYAQNRLPLLRIADSDADIIAAEAALAALSEGAREIVFFGTGGSGLGGQTLAQIAGWNIPGGRGPKQRTHPRTRFYDNLDPTTLEAALAAIDLDGARFVVTSKSGGTVETLAQAMVTLSAIKAKGLEARIPNMFLGITEPASPGKTNGLRALFDHFKIPMLDHHTGIGGRFSCLTNVGLMPAIARGLDARAIRRGAKFVIDELLAAKSPETFAPAIGAATAVALAEQRGIRTLVMMPYADRLGLLAAWFVQLWAESLGKAGKGTSPIAALGPLDQHSQLQLFMDGPREHYLTLVRVQAKGSGPKLDAGLAAISGAPYLGGKTVGDIVAAQADALPEALASACRPVRTIDIDRINEESIGALLMHFMLETILAGRLMGVDPFNQPAVELAKVLTRKRLTS